jgi:hypothetical protein
MILKVSATLDRDGSAPHFLAITVIWRKRCLDEFLELRQANENGNMLEPESWREQYFVRLGLSQKKPFSTAGLLIYTHPP